MKSINQVTLLGNITRDPEMRYTPSGAAVINFSIATNRSYKDSTSGEYKEVADFHNVVFWAKAAEIIGQYCSKGDKICVQGRLQTRSWEAKDGSKRYTTEVVGQDFILLTPKGDTAEPAKEPETVSKKADKPKSQIEKDADEIFGDNEVKEETPGKPEEAEETEKSNKNKPFGQNPEDVDPDDIPF